MASTWSVLVLMTIQGWTRAAPADTSDGASVLYDQRQSGEYNIHVYVKDVDIIALLASGGLGDYGDYDYSYDYNIPQNPWEPSTTTQKPSSVTSASTAAASPSSSAVTSTITTAASPSSSAATSTITTAAMITESASSHSDSSSSPSSNSTSNNPEPTEGGALSNRSSVTATKECSKPTKEPVGNQQEGGDGKGSGKGRRRCSTGFIRDSRGRCRRLRRPAQHHPGLQLPFGLRLFPRPVAPVHADNS